jgi:hypothetical protein
VAGSALQGPDAAVAGDVAALAVAGFGDEEAAAVVGEGDGGGQPEAGFGAVAVGQAVLARGAGEQAEAVAAEVVGPDDVVLDVGDGEQAVAVEGEAAGGELGDAGGVAGVVVVDEGVDDVDAEVELADGLVAGVGDEQRRATGSRARARGPWKRALRQPALMMPGVPGVPART